MDRITKGEAITLDNDIEYVVVDAVELDNKRYLYLVSEDKNEVLVAEEIIEDNDIFVETLTDMEKVREISKIVVERLDN
ncbi:MAG TPA: hypothetical protein GX725_01670 [Mollicutes bacterium]|mgnify:CR=1 FL=1|jgi:hypothetical protein|nr:hypothetical protein [Mollicutes bacterium]